MKLFSDLKFISAQFAVEITPENEEKAKAIKEALEKANNDYTSILSQSVLRYSDDLNYLKDK